MHALIAHPIQFMRQVHESPVSLVGHPLQILGSSPQVRSGEEEEESCLNCTAKSGGSHWEEGRLIGTTTGGRDGCTWRACHGQPEQATWRKWTACYFEAFIYELPGSDERERVREGGLNKV